MNVLGSCQVAIQCGDGVANENMYFVNGPYKIFLSLSACTSLVLVDPNFPNHVVSSIQVGKNERSEQFALNKKSHKLSYPKWKIMFLYLNSGC